MKYLALAAAAFFAALATPAPASAQDGDVRYFLRLSIVTGDDDLRGGRDSVRGSYRLGETWSTPVLLNRRGARWPDRSRNVAEISLPTEDPNLRNLNAVKLQTSFSGGMGGDNWNMDQLYIQVCLARGRESLCSDLGQHGPRRFTADRGELIVPIRFPVSDNPDIK